MPTYIVNKNAQSTGEHEVHNQDAPCGSMPDLASRIPLGWHADCSSAVREANNRGYKPADGCANCAPSCHTR